MKKINLILLFAFIYLTSNSQTFTRSSKINTNSKMGLHKIEITPAYQQLMCSDFHDVRIFDSSKVEIPYIILCEPMLKSKTDFIEYSILSQKHFRNYTEIVIDNKNHDKISNIAFNINNSDALKYCSIEGSNDLKQWYSVSALQSLGLTYNENYTNQYKCIYFPLNDYAYFRLLIDDWHSPSIDWMAPSPFKVNSAGYFKNSYLSGKLNPVSFKKEISNDVVTKKTIIKLVFGNNQTVNQLSFKISKPRLFLRAAKIYVLEEEKLKTKKIAYYKNTIFDFELNSEKPLIFDIPATNNKEIYIEIENNDNQVLQIDSLICNQLASYMVFDCVNSTNYCIKCGDTKLHKPIYDIINFVNESPQLLPQATLTAFENIETPKNEIVKEKQFYETKLFLWACIFIGVIAIGLFSWKLMKDMKKEEA